MLKVKVKGNHFLSNVGSHAYLPMATDACAAAAAPAAAPKRPPLPLPFSPRCGRWSRYTVPPLASETAWKSSGEELIK